MRKKLETPFIEILHTRTTISRETKLFYLKEIADNWEVHPSTVARYEKPEYRKYATEYARKITKLLKKDKTRCQECALLLEKHIRCPDCTMLLHGEPTCSCKAIREYLKEY